MFFNIFSLTMKSLTINIAMKIEEKFYTKNTSLFGIEKFWNADKKKIQRKKSFICTCAQSQLNVLDNIEYFNHFTTKPEI